MKHQITPGEWETVAGPDSLAVCEPGGGDMIAEIVNGNVADRNLIAAAPLLLAACIEAENNYAPYDGPVLRQLRAAIARAKGEA